ncbi:MAG TPA: carboxylesterase family protein [Puia sp.]|nr:carboxylesterase family protein [Puia sp.]
MKNLIYPAIILFLPAAGIRAQGSGQDPVVATVSGQGPVVATMSGSIQGTVEASGVHSFKGIPYAAPPVGDLRFRDPQPVGSWQGIRKTQAFGPRAMQLPIYGDMKFRSAGVSEDCLYLNVWAPASGNHLPVLVYFYGGGFSAGDGSEYRYDGESMAKRGIVAVTVNYRLGIFGFLAHPDLTKESPHHSSGNYGLLDQHAALEWVQRNIAAFGGDPARVTIAGESAGSISVCAQMASPLSKGLFAGAIGESGGLTGNIKPEPLDTAEKQGAAFAARLGNKSIADLRAMSATDLLQAAAKGGRFWPIVDGYFLPEAPDEIYSAGDQMKVPLLAGWNSAEVPYQGVLGASSPTVENFEAAVRKLYGDQADEVLNLYKATTPEEVRQAATDLATNRFIAYSTWKWIDRATATGEKPVYRYLYAHPRPPAVGAMGGQPAPMGASHSWEIEYALGNLHTNTVYAWTADDDKVSATMEAYFANFIKTGDPNGKGLPTWPPMKSAGSEIMVIDVHSHVEREQHADRYRWMDQQN